MGSRVTGNGAGKIYEAASAWVDCALRADDSFFTPGNPIWTSQGLSELHNRFLDQPDAGEGSFTEKLQVQLQGSSPEVYQLMAEVLYVHLLVIWPAVMGPPAKKNLINRVLGWASGDIEMPDRMSECLSYGLARPGQGYIIFRQYQVGCLIEFVEQWKTKAREERDQLLEDPWTFKEFVMGVQLQSRLLINRQNTPKAQRQILLHLVHPDTFEGIVSADHRTLISNAEGFAHYTSEGATDIDRRIQQIRQGIEAETGADFSFYDGLIHRKWNPSKVSPWDEYVKQASECREAGLLDGSETDYEEVGDRLAQARGAALTRANDWSEMLRTALPSSTSLKMRSNPKTRLGRWLGQSQEDALKALRAIWAEGEIPLQTEYVPSAKCFPSQRCPAIRLGPMLSPSYFPGWIGGCIQYSGKRCSAMRTKLSVTTRRDRRPMRPRYMNEPLDFWISL